MSSKLPYNKPIIERQVTGLINKFGRRGLVAPLDQIDGVPVARLVEEFGSPLFVLSEETMRRKYREAHQAFSLQYPRVQFGWSYKTNYLNAVCAIFHQEGAWAEVVSEMEYDRARRLGMPGNQIIYNGPYKTTASLERAAKEGARLHIDHLDELFQLERIAGQMKKKLPVAIRINLDAGIYPVWSRFGFNLENGQALRAIQRMVNGGKLVLSGLHTHLGTFILDPDAYQRAVVKLLDFAALVEKEFGLRMEYLDLGGGFASRNRLLEQYLPGEHASPSFDQYARAICGALQDSSLTRKDPPLLILETGRALVDEGGYLISTVVAKKSLVDGRKALVIDVGVNLAFTAFWYNLEVVPAQPFDGYLEDTVVYGPLCMNIDVIRNNIRLPDLRTGDRLVIKPVGAYNLTQWMQFIHLRPAVVMIGPKQRVDLIRRAETLDDIMGLETLPERLQVKG
jgi:diaminopimelate decarboxylase